MKHFNLDVLLRSFILNLIWSLYFKNAHWSLNKIGFQSDFYYYLSNWQVLTKRELENATKIPSSNCITFRLRTSRNRDKLASSGLLWYRFDRSQIHFYEPTSISLALVLRTLTLWDQQLLWCSNFNQLMMLKKNGQWCDILRP